MGETTPHARLPGNPSNAVAPLGEAPLYEGEDRAASPLHVYALQNSNFTLFCSKPKRTEVNRRYLEFELIQVSI